MTLQIEYSATFFPFFNKVEANEINPKLDDSLSPEEEKQIIITQSMEWVEKKLKTDYKN